MSRGYEKNTGFATAFSNLLTGGEKGGIERQERQGQVELIHETTRLPMDMGRDGREVLEKAGVVFGNKVDELFLTAVLPAGWTIKAENHTLYSSLLDDKGRKRANIFYKAAFYDQRADLRVSRRYSVRSNFPTNAEGNPAGYNSAEHTHTAVAVMDFETVIKIFHILPSFSRDYQRNDKVTEEAEAYLDGQFPNWRDPSAYWD